MCTLTVRRTPTSLLVTMNRDESDERGPEGEPVVHNPEADAARWVGPIDSESRGSWFGVNEAGCVAALLNRYDVCASRPASNNRPSRGAIVPGALNCGGPHQNRRWLDADFDVRLYSPFTLVLASMDCVSAHSWDGKSLLERLYFAEEWTLITSSSWNQAEVVPWRAQQFDAWRASGRAFMEDVPAFHLLRPSGMEAWAPLMRRDGGRTRSIVQASISRDRPAATLRYWARPEPALARPITLELDLRAGSIAVESQTDAPDAAVVS